MKSSKSPTTISSITKNQDDEPSKSGADDAETCQHQERRILPQQHSPPSEAWQDEDLQEIAPLKKCPERQRGERNNPKVHRRLRYERCGADECIGEHRTRQNQIKEPISKNGKPKVKTKLQRAKASIADILRPQYFTMTLIATIVAIHSVCGKECMWMMEWYPGSWLHEPWRLLSYGLVHSSTQHLTINCVTAFTVGWFLERIEGGRATALVWCSGVAGGALGSATLQPRTRIVGASAGIHALLAAHLPHLLLRYDHISLWWLRLIGVFVTGSAETSWSIFHILMEPPFSPPLPPGPVSRGEILQEHIAWGSHVGGAVIGLPVGFVVFSGEHSSKLFFKVCKALSQVFLAALCMLTVGYYAYRRLAGDSDDD